MNQQLVCQLFLWLGVGMLLLAGCAGTRVASPVTSTATAPVPASSVIAQSELQPTQQPPSPTAPLPAPSATAQPVPQPTQQLILAKDKPPARMLRGRAVHQVPGMDGVKVANVPYKDNLTTDIYYPPDTNPDTRLPIVVFVNGVGDTNFPDPLKDSDQYISWGQLTAASGMIAITYEAHQPYEDALDLMDFLMAHGDRLGIDPTRMVLWACSANLPTALQVLMNTSAGYQASLRGAVFYYGIMQGEGDLPPQVPLFVVKSGKDSAQINSSIDAFLARARSQKIPLEFIEYAEGVHAFDVRQDADQSRAIIRQTLDFMKEKLLENQ